MANERYELRYKEWTKVRNDPFFTEYNYKWVEQSIKFKNGKDAVEFAQMCQETSGIDNVRLIDLVNGKTYDTITKP